MKGWALYFGFCLIIFSLFDINKQLGKVIKLLTRTDEKKEKLKALALKDYLNKKVSLTFKDDVINQPPIMRADAEGEIIGYDDNFLIFKFYNVFIKKNVYEYVRISDVESINEII